MLEPFFVIGAPRSGTTFLMQVLNRHPEIFLTNETRVLTFLNRVVNRLGKQKFVLQQERNVWLEVLKESLPALLEDFYQRLGATAEHRWGDKFPHYADPRMDPECLDLIDELFPGSQFVHIYRDGRDVVNSLVRKGWTDLAGGCDVWRRHVLHARAFGYRVGLSRYLEVRYEDLVVDSQAVVAELWAFLRVPASSEVDEFLMEEERSPTPFSRPTTAASELGRSRWSAKLQDDDLDAVDAHIGDALVEFGYEDPGRWLRSVVR